MNSPEDVSRSLRENFGTTCFNITGPIFQRCILRVRKPSAFWDESSKGCLSCGHGVAEIPGFCAVWFFDYEFIVGRYDKKWNQIFHGFRLGISPRWIPSTKINLDRPKVWSSRKHAPQVRNAGGRFTTSKSINDNKRLMGFPNCRTLEFTYLGNYTYIGMIPYSFDIV